MCITALRGIHQEKKKGGGKVEGPAAPVGRGEPSVDARMYRGGGGGGGRAGHNKRGPSHIKNRAREDDDRCNHIEMKWWW